MSDDLYRGRHRAPAGRHRALIRAKAPRSSLPRFARPGYLLPTAAAATLVLTATGAHFGGAVGLGAVGQTAQNAVAGALPSAGSTGDAIDRLDGSDRIARDSDRGSVADSSAATDALPDSTSTTSTTSTAAPAAGDQAGGQAEAQAAAAAAAKQAEDAAAAQAAQAAQVAQAAQDQAAKAAADAQAATKSWVAPIGPGSQLTSGFGMRWGAMHPGQDFAVAVGTPVKAMSSGTVIFAGWSGGYGNKVEIQYWDGTVSWFAHNSQLLVAQGDKVTPGETVSLSGNTGHSTGPHLHVEIHPGNGDPVPPIGWLTAKGIMP